MAYELKRPNASRYDLKDNGEVEWLTKCMNYAVAFGKRSLSREPVLVNLINEFGGDWTYRVLVAFCSREMNDINRFVAMARKEEPLEFVKPKEEKKFVKPIDEDRAARQRYKKEEQEDRVSMPEEVKIMLRKLGNKHV